MSGERRMRRDRERAPIKQAIRVALDAARSNGCCCRPEVTVGEMAPGAYSATVSHDDWCPLIRSTAERPPSKGWRP